MDELGSLHFTCVPDAHATYSRDDMVAGLHAPTGTYNRR